MKSKLIYLKSSYSDWWERFIPKKLTFAIFWLEVFITLKNLKKTLITLGDAQSINVW